MSCGELLLSLHRTQPPYGSVRGMVKGLGSFVSAVWTDILIQRFGHFMISRSFVAFQVWALMRQDLALWSFYDIAQFCRISSMGFNATGPRFDAPVLRRRFDAPVLLSPPCDCPTSGGDWAFLGFDMVPRMVVPSQVWDLMRQDLGPMRQRISRLTFNATGTRSNATETVALFRYRLQCDSNFANS